MKKFFIILKQNKTHLGKTQNAERYKRKKKKTDKFNNIKIKQFCMDKNMIKANMTRDTLATKDYSP